MNQTVLTCSSCSEPKPREMFYRNVKKERRCRKCVSAWMKGHYVRNRSRKLEYARAYREANPDRVAATKRRQAFGITAEEYEALLAEQDHCCAICKTPQHNLPLRLAVDHDHATGTLRGLLCGACNVALGLLKESEERLLSMIAYCKKYKK